MTDRRSNEPAEAEGRGVSITAVVLSVGIVVVMAAVHTFITYRGANVLATKQDEQPPTTRPEANGRSCLVTSKPSGATVHAIVGEAQEALGVTPVDIEQGAYTVRITLEHHHPAELVVGVHDGECVLHRDLSPVDSH